MIYLRAVIKQNNLKRIFWIGFIIVALLALWLGYRLYQRVMAPAVFLDEESVVFYVDDGTSFPDLSSSLLDNGYIRDSAAFRLLSERKGLTERIRPGRYRLKDRMSLNALVNMFRGGVQEPLRLVLRPERDVDDVIAFLGTELQPSAEDFRKSLFNDSLLNTVGLDRESAELLLIPNTYEFWWTTSADAFVKRMTEEYDDFWSSSRRQKAAAINLSPKDVGILASIVQEETTKTEEMPRIAGVYLNRLRLGMLLQADPTVKYAVGDPGIRRVLHKHLTVDSPYNTYKNKGLPPGPISMPEIQAMDAVLNAEEHDYLFFCARADLSGYHAFARTNAEHARNANAYRRALNQRRIYE